MRRIVTPEGMSIVGYGVALLGLGIVFASEMLQLNIPYSYRGTPLDVIDYAAGRNVFNRDDSLQ